MKGANDVTAWKKAPRKPIITSNGAKWFHILMHAEDVVQVQITSTSKPDDCIQ